MSFTDLLKFKDSAKPAAFSQTVEYTGNDLFRLSCGIIRCLPREDEYLLYCEDSFQFAAAFLALIHSGKKICLPPNSSPGIISELACGRFKVSTEWLKNITESDCPGPSKADDSRISLFTSGSTGERKEICKAPRQLMEEISVLENTWTLSKNVLATVSHQHIYGLLFKILWPLQSGRAFFTGTALYEDELNEIFKIRPESCLITCPAHLDALICFKEKGFIKNKKVFSSGAPLSLETAVKMKDISGGSPVEVFGSTETGGIAWREQTECPEWQLLESVEMRLDENILEVKSPFTENAGWYRTGDKAEFAGNRKFIHLGRGDRIAKVSGKRLSLTEMENKLASTQLVHSARIITVQKEGFTKRESTAACCILTDEGLKKLSSGKRKLTAELRKELDRFFDTVTLPRFWRFPEKMPCGSRGKLTDAIISLLFAGINEKKKRFPEFSRLEAEADSLYAKFDVKRSLIFFDGHFEEQPILPGVAQIFWAEWLAREVLGFQKSNRVSRLKFSKVIFPGSTVELKLHVKGNAVSFHLFNADKTFSSGVLHYEE